MKYFVKKVNISSFGELSSKVLDGKNGFYPTAKYTFVMPAKKIGNMLIPALTDKVKEELAKLELELNTKFDNDFLLNYKKQIDSNTFFDDTKVEDRLFLILAKCNPNFCFSESDISRKTPVSPSIYIYSVEEQENAKAKINNEKLKAFTILSEMGIGDKRKILSFFKNQCFNTMSEELLSNMIMEDIINTGLRTEFIKVSSRKMTLTLSQLYVEGVDSRVFEIGESGEFYFEGQKIAESKKDFITKFSNCEKELELNKMFIRMKLAIASKGDNSSILNTTDAEKALLVKKVDQ